MVQPSIISYHHLVPKPIGKHKLTTDGREKRGARFSLSSHFRIDLFVLFSFSTSDHNLCNTFLQRFIWRPYFISQSFFDLHMFSLLICKNYFCQSDTTIYQDSFHFEYFFILIMSFYWLSHFMKSIIVISSFNYFEQYVRCLPPLLKLTRPRVCIVCS